MVAFEQVSVCVWDGTHDDDDDESAEYFWFGLGIQLAKGNKLVN